MPVTLNGTNGLTFNDGTSQRTAASGFGFKNRIINGDMRIDQRNNGAAIASLVAGSTYTVDRFAYYGTQAAKFSAQRNAGSITPPAGFTNYLGFTSLAATTPGSGDIFQIYHNIEGVNVADLAWGTANAQAATLSFRVYSSVTGTHSGVLQNSAQNRTYGFTFSVPVANTWTTISLTIPGDTAGTWLTDNGAGVRVEWNLGTGSTYLGAGGSWSGSTFFGVTGSVNVCATNGATFYITGVQLEKGSTATSFDYRPYGTELQLCMRYYQHTFAQGTAPANGITSGFEGGAFAFSTSGCWFQRYTFPVVMRASPSVTLYRGNEGTTDGMFATYDSFWTSLTSTSTRQINTQGVHIEGVRSGAFTIKNAYLVSGNFTASAEL